MIHRLKRAIQKLLFCFKVAADFPTFSKLLINTKRFSWFRNEGAGKDDHSIVKYRIRYHVQMKSGVRDLYLRTYSGDIPVFYEIFWDQAYTYSKMPPTDIKCILDLGANIGLASLFFSIQYHDACIYAFEPDPENFELLKSNLAVEIDCDKVIAINSAVDPAQSKLYLKKSGFAYNVVTSFEGLEGIPVQAMNLNKFCREEGISSIDLLKVDIEGAEERLFKEHLEWLSIVKWIVVEIHSSQSRKICESALLSRGFSIMPGESNAAAGNLIWARHL